MWTGSNVSRISLACGMLLGARVCLGTACALPKINEFSVRPTQTGVCFFWKTRRQSHELFVPRYGGYSGAFKYIYLKLKEILLENSFLYLSERPYYPLQPQLCILPPLDITTLCTLLSTLSNTLHARTKTSSVDFTFTLPVVEHQKESHTLKASYKGRTAHISCYHCSRKASRTIVGPRLERRNNTIVIHRADGLLGFFHLFLKLHNQVVI